MDFVIEALAPYSIGSERDGTVAVPTQCLYPSLAAVTVYVQGGPNGAIVSDAGRAIDELTACNREIPDADRFLRRFCEKTGLKAEQGKIVSPKVSATQLAAAVAFVANASASAVAYGLDHLKSKPRRDVRAELLSVLRQTFPPKRITRQRFVGTSNRPYTFDYVIHGSGDRYFLVDPVKPDPNSINSRAIAHLDLKGAGELNLTQRLVYDEEDAWQAADLNLLRMAAPLIPLSRAAVVLPSEFRLEN